MGKFFPVQPRVSPGGLGDKTGVLRSLPLPAQLAQSPTPDSSHGPPVLFLLTSHFPGESSQGQVAISSPHTKQATQ